MTDGSSGYEAPPHNGRHLTCQSTYSNIETVNGASLGPWSRRAARDASRHQIQVGNMDQEE